MWREDLGVSRKVVNIKFLTKSLNKWYKVNKKHDVGEILRFVVRRLIHEQVPLELVQKLHDDDNVDENVLNYYNSCKLSKYYQVLMTRRQHCANGHQTSQKVTTVGFELKH